MASHSSCLHCRSYALATPTRSLWPAYSYWPAQLLRETDHRRFSTPRNADLQPLSQLLQLRAFAMEYMHSVTQEAFAHLGSLPALHTLSLLYSTLSSITQLAPHIQACSQLQYFSFTATHAYGPLTDQDCEALSCLLSLHTLISYPPPAHQLPSTRVRQRHVDYL